MQLLGKLFGDSHRVMPSAFPRRAGIRMTYYCHSERDEESQTKDTGILITLERVDC